MNLLIIEQFGKIDRQKKKSATPPLKNAQEKNRQPPHVSKPCLYAIVLSQQLQYM